jgi:hypothetical protein
MLVAISMLAVGAGEFNNHPAFENEDNFIAFAPPECLSNQTLDEVSNSQRLPILDQGSKSVGLEVKITSISFVVLTFPLGLIGAALEK